MSEQSNNSVGSLIGKIFIGAFPLSMIVMLGVVGLAFIFGRPTPTPIKKAAPAVAVVKAPAAPAKAAAPAPATVAKKEAPAAPVNDADDAPDAAVIAAGKTSYAMCAACHGMDGKGMKVGPTLMAPSLIGSKVLLGDPDLSLLVVLKGIAKEDMKFMGMMAPLGAALDDEKLSALLTYVRNEWGNKASAVTVEQAKAARAKFADVNAPTGVKRAEIEKIVAAHK